MASGLTLGKTIRKRMEFPPLVALLAILPHFYRLSNSHPWGRSLDNPIGGWYGLKKGLRGRFGMYLPPLMEELGLAEVEHNPKNNRMRAK